MAGHAQLKFVMTECSETQIRLTGPNLCCLQVIKRRQNKPDLFKLVVVRSDHPVNISRTVQTETGLFQITWVVYILDILTLFFFINKEK